MQHVFAVHVNDRHNVYTQVVIYHYLNYSGSESKAMCTFHLHLLLCALHVFFCGSFGTIYKKIVTAYLVCKCALGSSSKAIIIIISSKL